MSELGEKKAISVPSDPEPEKSEKQKNPFKIRIALFCDGTNNNRTNIEAKEQKKRFKLFIKPGSADNGRTNIAIMESHMEVTAPSDYDYFKSFYIPGQGTYDLLPNNVVGLGLGAGTSGVVSRAKMAVNKALSAITGIDPKIFNQDERYIDKITIDLYGFSRGAATARYAVHLLLKDKNNLFSRLKSFNLEIEESAIEVGFVGIYDTVLSYMNSQASKTANDKLKQTAHKEANKVLHLVAAGEHRKNFPLHNISCSKGSKGGEEYYLPGVHSDVGGSYNQSDEEKIKNETDPAKKRALMMVTSSEDIEVNKGELWEMETDKKWLIEQGWFKGTTDGRDVATIKKDAQTKIKQCEQQGKFTEKIKDGDFTITLHFMPGHDAARRYIRDTIFNHAVMTAKREKIQTGYANIPLKIMHKYVTDETKLTIHPKLLKRADSVIDICSLKLLETEIMQYVNGKPANSKVDDWENSEFLKKYRREHLHFSAYISLPNKPNFAEGQRKRYIYEA